MQMFCGAPFGEFLDVIEPSNPELVGSLPRFLFVAIPREEDEPAVAALLVLSEDDATPYTGVNSEKFKEQEKVLILMTDVQATQQQVLKQL
jgi:hypothetical protein